jgi:hypothetical protein
LDWSHRRWLASHEGSARIGEQTQPRSGSGDLYPNFTDQSPGREA